MDVDVVALVGVRVAPDGLQQAAVGQDAVRLAAHRHQQPVLRRGEAHLAPVDRDRTAVNVDGDWTDLVNQPELMGPAVNGRLYNAVAWLITLVISGAALLMVATQLLPLLGLEM